MCKTMHVRHCMEYVEIENYFARKQGCVRTSLVNTGHCAEKAPIHQVTTMLATSKKCPISRS